MIIKKIFEKFSPSFVWNRTNSPTVNNKNSGDSITTTGNNSPVIIATGADAKEISIEKVMAAMAELKYNGPGIGDASAPFENSRIMNLFTLPEPFNLSQETHNEFHNYLQNVAQCNAGRGIPGRVQQESKHLIVILENHLKFINSFK